MTNQKCDGYLDEIQERAVHVLPNRRILQRGHRFMEVLRAKFQHPFRHMRSLGVAKVAL